MKFKNLLKFSFFVLQLFLCFRTAQAQTKPISGKVTDSKSGEALPGVTVAAKGTTSGTTTDVNGAFRFSVPASATVLTVKYVGYDSKEVAITDANPVNITLEASLTALNEVKVVSIGYGTQDQTKVTSAITRVTPADFRQSGSRSALDLIQGKVAGLAITRTSGTNPNGGVSVQLRGAVSVTSANSPLIVIDGIPNGNLDLLQQDDIESIDVIKDGSGAAIYGSIASGGVILVTTKRGKNGPPRVDYSSYARKEYLNQRLKFLSADEYRQRIASGDIKQKDFGSSTDFVDQLINHDNLSQNHNLSFSGGTDQTSYRASLNYRDLQGIAKENGRKEYTIKLNMTQKGLNDHLRLYADLTTNINRANLLGGGGWENELTKNPTLSNFNPDGSYRFDLTSTNEFARLLQETYYRKQQTTSANVKADIDILKGLTGSVAGSVIRDSYVEGQYRLKASENSLENTDFPGGGYAYKGDYLRFDYNFEPTLQYKNTFFGKHNLTALAGYSYRYSIFETSSASNRGFINDLFHEDNLSQGSALAVGKASMSSNKEDNTLVALFGRLQYSYQGKYLLQGTIRREGSSRFGANNKFGYFPAVSAGWVLSEENFIKKHSFINFLKLRGGYGETGNSGFANYASLVTLGGGGRYIYPDGSYFETYGPNRNPNPNLKWEIKKETNIGLDFAMLNNRLTGQIEYYKRTVKDLLDTYVSPQPPFIQSSIYTNVGTLSASGLEFALGYAAIQGGNFRWKVDATFSYNLSNKLDSYSNDEYKVLYKTFAGIGGAGDLGNAITTYERGNTGEFWGKRFAGFTPDGKWLFYNRNGVAVPNSQINISKDVNTTDLAKIGNAIPKAYASLTNTFGYKRFDLRIFMRGRFGNDILNTPALSYANRTWSGNLLKSTFTKYSQINDTYQYSDYYIENGSFVKLDEVTLGYNFNFKTKYLRNVRLYITGQNLATITKYTGTDPDYIRDTGLDPGVDNRSAYPSTRSFLVGLNVGF
jgi:TonB-linked SusC/RagA family outer membrane protein